MVALGGIFPGVDVLAALNQEPPEGELSPKFALVTLLFLIAGLGAGALASRVLGS